MVFRETSNIREVERIEQPSTRAETTWARLASDSLFTLLFSTGQAYNVKGKAHENTQKEDSLARIVDYCFGPSNL
jgi:hypothetical protein